MVDLLKVELKILIKKSKIRINQKKNNNKVSFYAAQLNEYFNSKEHIFMLYI